MSANDAQGSTRASGTPHGHAARIMFAALMGPSCAGDDDAPPLPLPAAAPVAPRVSPVAAAKAFGGATHRAKVTIGRLRQLRNREKEPADAIAGLAAPSLAQATSRVLAPGPANASSASRGGPEQIILGDLVTSIVPQGKTDSRKRTLECRAVASHLQAQSTGLCDMVRRDGVESIWSSNAFDDATMWIRRPPQKENHVLGRGGPTLTHTRNRELCV